MSCGSLVMNSAEAIGSSSATGQVSFEDVEQGGAAGSGPLLASLATYGVLGCWCGRLEFLEVAVIFIGLMQLDALLTDLVVRAPVVQSCGGPGPVERLGSVQRP